MNSIKVFKTNVSNNNDALHILSMLSQQQPGSNINFDLDDCDHILRIECSNQIDVSAIIELLNKNNFECEVLN